MPNERLRQFFEAVKLLKQENEGLLGTGELLKMLKRQRYVIEGPQEIAAEINLHLHTNFPNPTYLATPERVNGLCSPISSFYRWCNKFGCESPDASDRRETLKILVPIFERLNSEGISEDGDGRLGAIFIDMYLEELKKHFPQEPHNIREIDYNALSSIDWVKIMSRKNLLEYERCVREDSSREAFHLKGLVGRAMNDKVEHRTEYRRIILSHLLSTSIFPGLSETRRSWEDYVRDYDESIDIEKGKIEGLRKLKESEWVPDKNISNFRKGIPLWSKSPEDTFSFYAFLAKCEGKDIPSIEEVISNVERNLEHLVYLRRILGQEKNWVKKILGE